VSDHDAISTEALNAALDAARAKAKALGQEVEALITRRNSAQREVDLLEELVGIRGGGRAPAGTEGESPQKAGSVAFKPRTPRRPAVRETIAELERAGKPLHISELMQLLESRGVPIPGSGQQANLIAHLTRAPEIVRPSRGMYGLATWGLPESDRVKPARRRRVRGASKSSSTGRGST
jgi:hypothetical protein